MFFNIGGGELLVIAMVALIAVGPEQLPSVLRKFGRGVAQIRSMTAGLREEFMSGLDEVTDVVDPKSWTGSGSDDDPVVPRGYAERQGEKDASGTNGDPTNGTGDDSPGVNKIAQANARGTVSPRFASAEPATATPTSGGVDDATVGAPDATDAPTSRGVDDATAGAPDATADAIDELDGGQGRDDAGDGQDGAEDRPVEASAGRAEDREPADRLDRADDRDGDAEERA